MEEGKPRPMGGFITVVQRKSSKEAYERVPDDVEPRALSPAGCGLLEPYKDMPRPGSGILEPMAGFLDFNKFKEALDIESQNVSNSKARARQNSGHNSKAIYFPVDVQFDKLFDWSKAANGKNLEENNNNNNMNNNNSGGVSATGKLVNVNNTDVAIFRYNDQLLATSDKCPHAGGPLHLGDIEMLPDKSLCVRCPWHRWKFRLGAVQGSVGSQCSSVGSQCTETSMAGECVYPKARKDKRLKIFPAKVDESGNKVQIGFDSFDSKTLRDEEY